MVNMTVEIGSDARALIDMLKSLELKIGDIGRIVLPPALQQGVDIAKSKARVKTGRMRDGVQSRMIGQFAGEIFDDVEYAIYQEFGTTRISPNLFMSAGMAAAGMELERQLQLLLNSLSTGF